RGGGCSGWWGQEKRKKRVIRAHPRGVETERGRPARLRHYGGGAVGEVQPPYFGDILPRVDVVVDHHPLVAEYEARYRDVRCSFGSTATIFVQYLQAVEAKITQRLATALYYGLKTDTLALEPGKTGGDVEG